MGTSPSTNATNFRDFYNDLYTNEASSTRMDKSSEWYNKMDKVATDREWRPPTKPEMMRAINDLRNTAPGLSGIPAPVWKAIADDATLNAVVLKIMRKCWDEEKVPDDWVRFYMIVLEKNGDLSLPKNYRGIAIAEAVAKIYASILKERLTEVYEGVAPEFANGFRKKRGRADSINAVLNTLRKRKQWGTNSYLVLFDIIKCFDRIKRAHIWTSMRTMGISEKMIRVVQSTLKNTTAILHVEGEQRQVNIQEGTGQGTTLGPILCNLFLLPLLIQWTRHGATTPRHSRTPRVRQRFPSCTVLQTTPR
jgi:hypothetical protein